MPSNLADALSQGVERIASANQSGAAPRRDRQRTFKAQPSAASKSTNADAPAQNRRLSDVAQYYKSKDQVSGASNYLGDKLVDSTWTHIHEAMLHAREGDVANSTLHMKIANQAMREAVHYLEEERCAQFLDNVGQMLERVNAQAGSM